MQDMHYVIFFAGAEDSRYINTPRLDAGIIFWKKKLSRQLHFSRGVVISLCIIEFHGDLSDDVFIYKQ